MEVKFHCLLTVIMLEMIVYDYELISSAAAIIYELGLGVSVLQLLCYDFYDMTFMTVALALVVGPQPHRQRIGGAAGLKVF